MTKILSIALATAAVLMAQPPKPAPGKTAPKEPVPTVRGNLRNTAGTASPTAAPPYTRLKFPPLREVRIPDIAQFTLPNGMRVFLLENHELPLVSGFALVRTGNLFDPPDKVGLAGFTGSIMRSGGTNSKTGDQLDEELESIAASVESGIGETSGTVSFSALKENTDAVMAVFRDVMLHPEFRQDKLDLAKTQARGSISRRNDEASSIAGREAANLIYGRNNPYGWEMEYFHLDNIKREDLIAFYKRYFFPSNIMLAVQGDFNSAEMRSRIEKLFGGWDYKQAPVPKFPAVANTTAAGVYQAVKEDVTQSFIRMGHLGGTLSDKNYPALSVMADILGSGFSSRLFTQVRTIKGLAYNIGANWGANYNHPGLFMVSGSTKSQSTVDTIQAAKQEIQRIQTSEVTDQELETAKQSVLNSFVFFFDHPSKILNRMVLYEYHGYPKDFIFQYQKGVEAVTKADVLRVAKEYLKPDDLTIVAVGNPKDFGKPLSTLGTVKDIDLTIPDAKPGVAPAKADTGAIERGRKLLVRAQAAAGGADKLAAIKDVSDTAELNMNTPQGAMKAKQENRWVAPTHYRQSMELPFGRIDVYYDGKSGWFNSPQGMMAVPPPVAKQVQEALFRNMYTLLLSDRNQERTVAAVADNGVQITDKAGNSVRVDFDPATGLPAKSTYKSIAMTGEPATVTETFSDYGAVNGVMRPRKMVIEQNGQKFADVTYTDTKINSGITAEQISQKP
jgi:zinc protease